MIQKKAVFMHNMKRLSISAEPGFATLNRSNSEAARSFMGRVMYASAALAVVTAFYVSGLPDMPTKRTTCKPKKLSAATASQPK